ncbi:hypothetical protein BSG1_01930 [Bacillus sp. SG-1]|nr:hypothetical protein BSG1_01930 [Bacillus sp. SG-1]
MVKETTAVYEVFAIWEYDSYEKYEKIDKKVINDEEHVKRVQNWYKKMGGKKSKKGYFIKLQRTFQKRRLLRRKQ